MLVESRSYGRAIVVGSAIAFAFAVSGVAAVAQPGPGGGSGRSGWGPGMMMGPGMMGNRGFAFMCNPRAAGFAEWRLQEMERAVHPTDAQRAALDALKTASAKAAEQIASGCPAQPPAKSTERLAFMEQRLETMQQAIKTVRPAFEAFYAGLDDQQKARLDATGPQRWGWRNWRWRWTDQ